MATLFDQNHARVLVVGPMGVGKSSLVHALCHGGEVLQRPRTTVGCNVDVKMLPGGRADRFIEFWDVGGHPDAAPARRMFFDGGSSIAGVVLVYDLSNPRSTRELPVWIDDLESAGIKIDLGAQRRDGDTAPDSGSSVVRPSSWGLGIDSTIREQGNLNEDLEGGGGPRGSRGCVPVLVVGNKEDAWNGRAGLRQGAEKMLPLEFRTARVAVVSARKLDEEPFLKFFDDVFRHHMGYGMSAEGGDSGWTLLNNNTATSAVGSGEGRDPRASTADTPTQSIPGAFSAMSSSRFDTVPGFDECRREGIAGRRVHAHLGTAPDVQGSDGSGLEASNGSGNWGRFTNSNSVSGGVPGGVGRVWPAHHGTAPSARRSREKQS